MRKTKKPRFLHQLYAFINGYFWLPCSLCGKSFGGHEEHGSLMTSWSGGKTVCIGCADEADRLNKIWMKDNPCPPIEINN